MSMAIARVYNLPDMQDILYLKSLDPIAIEPNPSEVTISFAKALSDSLEFRRGQKLLAKDKYGLGQELLYAELGKSFYDLPLSDKASQYFSALPGCNLLDKTKPLSLIDSLLLLLSFNAFVDTRYLKNNSFPLFRYVFGKEEIGSLVKQYPIPQLSAILIPHNTSQAEFITWVKDNWQEIEDGNKKLGKFVTRELPKNLEIGVEIGEWLDQSKTYKDIAGILSDKYPSDERMADYNQLKTIHSRYKDFMIQSLLSTTKLGFLQK
jgi:hypothetical protein